MNNELIRKVQELRVKYPQLNNEDIVELMRMYVENKFIFGTMLSYKLA